MSNTFFYHNDVKKSLGRYRDIKSNFDKHFYGQRSSRAKIEIGEYGINKDEIDTGVEVLNASNSGGESEEELSPESASTHDSVLFSHVESDFLEALSQVSLSNRRVLDVRWRSRPAPCFNSLFIGASYPPPPVEEPTPLQFFKMFLDDELIDLLAEQTNLYSVSKSGNSVNTNLKEIKQILGILIMMGVIKLPRYQIYWSQDTQIPVNAEVMGVTRFENLKRFFHCNDNQKMLPKGDPNFDKLFKVRPVLDSVLKKCQAIPQKEKHTIDEHIIPTKCRSRMRQYFPKKPNKWGIKVWARCGVSGIVFDFEVYTGKSLMPPIPNELGVMRNLVLRLTSRVPDNVGHKVYFDNLFSPFLFYNIYKTEVYGVYPQFALID